LERERQFGRRAEPFAVDAAPVGARNVVVLEEFIDRPPIVSVVGWLVDNRRPALGVEGIVTLA
jgi:hypothetical protein